MNKEGKTASVIGTGTGTKPHPVINARFLLKQESKVQSANAFSLDVDICIPGRGVTAIFGQSGSGKTTLLRCIAGLEKAQQGLLNVNGDVWQDESSNLPTHKRPLGYVFQESSLFAHLTAQGNLDYALKRSASKILLLEYKRSDQYQHIISIMGIASILQRYPSQLSGGERQRVAIARALLIQPKILLMDEPLASLDTARKQEILPYLEQLRDSIDTPILYVSHSMDEVARLADHCVVLEEGKVTSQGTLTHVFSSLDLKQQLVHETAVILSGKVTQIDTQWHLVKFSTGSANGIDLWIKDEAYSLGQALRIRILAKDISLALSASSDSSILNKLAGKIVEMADDSDLSMTRVRISIGEEYLVARLTRKSVHDLQLTVGKTIWAQIKSAAVVL